MKRSLMALGLSTALALAVGCGKEDQTTPKELGHELGEKAKEVQQQTENFSEGVQQGYQEKKTQEQEQPQAPSKMMRRSNDVQFDVCPPGFAAPTPESRVMNRRLETTFSAACGLAGVQSAGVIVPSRERLCETGSQQNTWPTCASRSRRAFPFDRPTHRKWD